VVEVALPLPDATRIQYLVLDFKLEKVVLALLPKPFPRGVEVEMVVVVQLELSDEIAIS
jgi:hypothetical protein